MFIDYKVISTRRMFLSEGTDIEMVKKALAEDPAKFINDDSWEMEIAEDDVCIDDSEKFLPLEMADGATIELYGCDEDESETPDWSNVPMYRSFNEGEIIEVGDQVLCDGHWYDFDSSAHGMVIDPTFGKNEVRKLVK